MAEPASSSARRKRPWALTFFGLLAIGGLASMPILAGEPNGEDLPDIYRFFGHFHPLVLHLPIGVFALILFQELGAIFRTPRPGLGLKAPCFPCFSERRVPSSR